MSGFADPRIRCVEHHRPATLVFEYWAPISAHNPDDLERHYVLACTETCFDTAWNAFTTPPQRGRITGAYPLTRRDAEEISGLDLGEVAA